MTPITQLHIWIYDESISYQWDNYGAEVSDTGAVTDDGEEIFGVALSDDRKAAYRAFAAAVRTWLAAIGPVSEK